MLFEDVTLTKPSGDVPIPPFSTHPYFDKWPAPGLLAISAYGHARSLDEIPRVIGFIYPNAHRPSAQALTPAPPLLALISVPSSFPIRTAR